MLTIRKALLPAAALALSLGCQAPSAHAQTSQMPSMSGMTGQTGAGGLLGSAMGAMGMPGVGQASAGNIAGVLSYCVQNNAVATGTGNTALSQLTGKGDVASSSGYQTGAQGLLQTGSANAFSLSNLTQPLKQRMCRAVLKRAQNLL